MKFELLPNEIFIECFEYLDVLDIFYSFNQLNDRLNKLIRNIPLRINFQYVRKAKFSQFCRQITLDPEIIQQISSLHLSNKDTCGQIKTFLSICSFNKYSNIHSLTLSHVEEENVPVLQSILPLCSKLYTFHLISPQVDEEAIIFALPISNIQKLSIISLRSFLIHIQQSTLITHLTILNCSLEQLLYQLFKYVPLLKYLNVECISKYNRSLKNNTIIDRYNAVHLKHLIIGQFKYRFEDFAKFVLQTPNLQNLTISADYDIGMFDANEWEILIRSSLSFVNIFKFKFGCHRTYKDFAMLNFKQFQTDFWVKQHQWYTQILFEKFLLYIHTIPYLSNIFKLEFNSRKSSNELVNVSNIFDKVTNLTLFHEQITDKCLYRFSNLISLKIVILEQEIIDYSISKYLKMIVNLSNLKHLAISQYQRLILSGELLIILKESSQLSSLTI
ncbi:unnamed protein product [Rotaria sordida]|uniref:F-box domain-containing protein n=1 Tax=Rotaria sordida TaxID=392033 RepID=A0A819MBK6_9BILA|nr:unnamed protein product [Rotaria sordida]CAF1382241.1 unnamed protein product [Rotaria sordida]CAF1547972.1 unnamed protein product [Rotaria sordida]CAF3977258.1 unnamed protein product [Rotaria sordida]